MKIFIFAVCILFVLGFVFILFWPKAKKKNKKRLSIEKYPEIFPKNYCPHEKQKGLMLVKVLEDSIELKDFPYCKECAEKFLNEYSTVCNVCKKPIFPGQSVGISGDKEHPYTHLTFSCCPSGGLWCGMWGMGELLGIDKTHEKKDLGKSNTGIDIVSYTPKKSS